LLLSVDAGAVQELSGIVQYRGLSSVDAGTGNRTSMNEFGCKKESMEEYAEERGGKSD
jgi:hypothetical protein